MTFERKSSIKRMNSLEQRTDSGIADAGLVESKETVWCNSGRFPPVRSVGPSTTVIHFTGSHLCDHRIDCLLVLSKYRAVVLSARPAGDGFARLLFGAPSNSINSTFPYLRDCEAVDLTTDNRIRSATALPMASDQWDRRMS